jgi:hypothetical protein
MTSTLIKELLNEAHNHLQDVRFYAEAREMPLCIESLAKVYALHEQIDSGRTKIVPANLSNS